MDLYQGFVEILRVFAHDDGLAKSYSFVTRSHSEGSLSELVWASRGRRNETPKVTSQRPRKLLCITCKQKRNKITGSPSNVPSHIIISHNYTNLIKNMWTYVSPNKTAIFLECSTLVRGQNKVHVWWQVKVRDVLNMYLFKYNYLCNSVASSATKATAFNTHAKPWCISHNPMQSHLHSSPHTLQNRSSSCTHLKKFGFLLSVMLSTFWC